MIPPQPISGPHLSGHPERGPAQAAPSPWLHARRTGRGHPPLGPRAQGLGGGTTRPRRTWRSAKTSRRGSGTSRWRERPRWKTVVDGSSRRSNLGIDWSPVTSKRSGRIAEDPLGIPKDTGEEDAQLPPPLTEEETTELRRVVAQVGRLWTAQTTTNQDRKEIARLLIHHVEANRTSDSLHLDAKVHWVSGHITSETVKLNRRGRPKGKITDSALQIIRRMAGDYTDREIAICLTKAGREPEGEPRWSAWRVKQIRKEHGWEKRREKEGDTVSENEARQMLGITKRTVEYWIRRGKLRSRQVYPNTRHRILRKDVERLTAERKRLGMRGGHQGGRAWGL